MIKIRTGSALRRRERFRAVGDVQGNGATAAAPHHQFRLAVGLGCLDQLLDVISGQLFASAQISICRTPARNCSISVLA